MEFKSNREREMDVSKLKDFFYPNSLDEVLEILRDESIKSRIVAGGTSLALGLDPSVEALIDISRVGLNYIKEEGGYVKIGATTTIQEIFKSPIVEGLANGMVKKAASLVGNRPIRNAVTLGGNIVQLKVWSDMPVVLLALDASIKVRGFEERVIPAADFFKAHPRKWLEPDEVVTEIVFPKTPDYSGGEYIKFSKTVGAYSIVSVACYMEFEEDECYLARIAVGAAEPLPKRCTEAEGVLENQKIDEELIEKASKLARECVKPTSNIWGSAEYKQDLVETLVKRAITKSLERAKKEGN